MNLAKRNMFYNWLPVLLRDQQRVTYEHHACNHTGGEVVESPFFGAIIHNRTTTTSPFTRNQLPSRLACRRGTDVEGNVVTSNFSLIPGFASYIVYLEYHPILWSVTTYVKSYLTSIVQRSISFTTPKLLISIATRPFLELFCHLTILKKPAPNPATRSDHDRRSKLLHR